MERRVRPWEAARVAITLVARGEAASSSAEAPPEVPLETPPMVPPEVPREAALEVLPAEAAEEVPPGVPTALPAAATNGGGSSSRVTWRWAPRAVARRARADSVGLPRPFSRLAM
jgi:hypothetical protein